MTAAAVTMPSASWALARREASLVLTAPAAWLTVLLQVALGTLWYAAAESVAWTVIAREAGLSSLVLAGFLLLTGHLAGSRDHRHGAAEASSVLPASALRRTVALLALVPAAGVLGAVALGAQLAANSFRWPADSPNLWQLTMPVLIPMVGAAIGVATSRWWRTTAAGPLTLFGCTAILAMLPVFGPTPQALSWVLFPVQFSDVTVAAWHAAYLVTLVVGVVAVALLRHRRLVPAVTLLIALVLVVVTVSQQHPDL
jgi:heme A synthase